VVSGAKSLGRDADTPEERDHAALLARCRAGNQGAWRELVATHFDFVYRVARRLGTPAEELEDVCQETFLVVHQKAESFSQGRLQTWLYRIAANIALHRHRRRRFRRALAQLLGVGGLAQGWEPRAPDRVLETREADQAVQQVLEAMSWKKREAFVLYEIEGLDSEEIAERLGCSAATVRTRLHHARRQFASLARKRGVLAALGGDDEAS
jgi:RNA polymerase sigma-70 factor (ECF subfamily)